MKGMCLLLGQMEIADLTTEIAVTGGSVIQAKMTKPFRLVKRYSIFMFIQVPFC